MDTDSTENDAPITRGGQPLEQGPPPEEMVAAEQEREAEIAQEREQIGTTRGGQPIENVRRD